MAQHELARRTVLKAGASVGLAGLTTVAGPARAFAAASRGDSPTAAVSDVVLPWADQPAPIPDGAVNILGHPLIWESLDSWRTPNDAFFTVKHYNQPALSSGTWTLTVDGLVECRQTMELEDLKDRSRHEVDFTLECSGNNGLPFLIGGVGNARWAGTPLAPILKAAKPRANGVEVVFWGADQGQVTIRDNSGVTGPGLTGTVEPDSTGGLDLTITEHFARSMSLADAMNPDNLLCYGMNGDPLPAEHGYPLRLIAPGWYGVANVKWLTRIEIRDGRYTGRFMARDYVTIREEKHLGETVWTFTNVSHDRLKSAPAKVTRRGHKYSVMGAAWGGSVGRVDVRVDNGAWHRAALHRMRPRGGSQFSWSFWTWEWGTPPAGTHTITSRVVDDQAHVQPLPTDPYLASRRTYWENNGQITRTVVIP